MAKPKVAVTGASGHLGLHVVLKLEENGYPVRAMYYSQQPPIKTNNTQWIKGNILESESIEELIQGCDVVIHSAGLVQLQRNSREVVLETNVLGTQNVIDHCVISGRPIRLIHISSTSAVTPFPRHEKMTEDRPHIKATGYAYAWSKSLSEQSVIQAIYDNNLDAIILRPSALMGPPDFKPSIFGSAVLKFLNNEIPALTSGGYNFIDIRDAAQTVVNSIAEGKKGSIYNVGGQFRTMRQMNQVISKFSGCKVPAVTIPTGLIILLEPIVRLLYDRKGKETPFNKENLFFVKNAPTKLDSTKAIKELRHQTRPLKDTIKELVEWFKENKYY